MEYKTTICVLVYIFFVYLSQVISQADFEKPVFNEFTPYFWIKDANERIQDNEYDTVQYGENSCSVKCLNVIFRHAARYPNRQLVEKFLKLHTALENDASVVAKNPFVGQWSNPFPEDKENQQSPVGLEEMNNLGRRFYRRFKNIITKYASQIDAWTTSKDPTNKSFGTFYQTLVENVTTFSAGYGSNDLIIRYYEHCNKYKAEVIDNEKTLSPMKNFLKGEEFRGVTSNIRQKLGTANVTEDDVITLYELCALELGLFNRSDWCTLFNMADLLILDYLKDIKNYWKIGYGYDIDWQMTCPLTTRILFDNFRFAMESEDAPPASKHNFGNLNFVFAHMETLLPIYAAFGLYKDPQQFLANNYKANKNRHFRTSLIGSFSSNLAFGLYRCDDPDQTYVIRVFVNEEPVDIPACGNTTCKYTDFQNYYKAITTCENEKICKVDTSKSEKLNAHFVWVASLGLLGFLVKRQHI